MRAQKGFTLIEVMVVVGIIAILSAIAIPSYTDYIRRARITEATSQLGTMRVKMEQFFQDNRTYAGACTVLPATSVAMRPTPTAFFNFDCPNLNLTNYQIRAIGIAGTTMANFTYQLDMAPNTGVVMSTQSMPTGWATTNSAICWVLKKDGSC